jgi:putative flippase GtrA
MTSSEASKLAPSVTGSRLVELAAGGGIGGLVRYALVGTWNAIFGISLFAALTTAFGDWMPYLVALLIMHVVTVVVAYLLYRAFVFRVPVPLVAGFLRFESVYLSSLAINGLLLVLLVEVIGVAVVPAQVVALLTATAMTYLAHRRFTFVHRPKLGEPS